MGVGADDDRHTKMVNTRPTNGLRLPRLSTYPNDYYSKAKTLGVQIRIDVVRSARNADGPAAATDHQQPVCRRIYT